MKKVKIIVEGGNIVAAYGHHGIAIEVLDLDILATEGKLKKGRAHVKAIEERESEIHVGDWRPGNEKDEIVCNVDEMLESALEREILERYFHPEYFGTEEIECATKEALEKVDAKPCDAKGIFKSRSRFFGKTAALLYFAQCAETEDDWRCIAEAVAEATMEEGLRDTFVGVVQEDSGLDASRIATICEIVEGGADA